MAYATIVPPTDFLMSYSYILLFFIFGGTLFFALNPYENNRNIYKFLKKKHF